MQRILPPILFLGALAAVLLLASLCPAPYSRITGTGDMTTSLLFPGLRMTGIALLLGGLALPLAGSRLFARLKTNIKTFNTPDKLVTSGLFRYSRNPMYLGFNIALAGAALASLCILSAIVCLAFFLACNNWYIPFEERMMHRTFGEEYGDYCQRTRRWI